MGDLTIAAPVAGLPAGPATEATVRAQLRVDDDLDDVSLELTINATNDVVVGFAYVDKFIQTIDPEAPDNAWPASIVLGATLLAARLFSRRNSTEGVAVFGEQGAVYVQRNDPDIAKLLKLGGDREPAVG